MKNTNTTTFESQLEQFVREHVASQRRAAAAAIERGFSSANSPRKKSATVSSKATVRRAPSEVTALSDRLFEAVSAHPGETMSVISPAVGETARALHRPMINLKRDGRVRSAGARSNTRYFPI